MSLCVFYCKEDEVLVCADSRSSIEDQNGNSFTTGDNSNKIRKYGDKLIISMGKCIASNDFFSLIDRKDSIEEIINKYKYIHNKYKNLVKRWKPEHEADCFCVICLMNENNKIVSCKINYVDDYIIEKQILTGNIRILAHGEYSTEVIQYIVNSASRFSKSQFNHKAKSIILDAFSSVADEKVGGYMYSYYVRPDRLMENEKVKIKDNRVLRTYACN